MRSNLRTFFLGALSALALPVAHAGGPLFIDEPTMQPVAWPNSVPVRVYTDLGALGTFSNEAADALVVEAFRQWTDVDTSAFSATIAGDMASVGLPDITGATANMLIGVDNGGGLHVVYDDDGSVLRNFFGVDASVLGIAMPEWGEGPVVTEAFVLLNGASVRNLAATPAQFSGVVAHEAGHAIGLAHSQTNGAAALYRDPTGPDACAVPYAASAPHASVETMYPVVQLWSVGTPMGTVDIRDDRVSLSNLYPQAGWSAATARITGRVLQPDGATPITGVNVVARNLADPFNDAVSVLSGDQTQGRAGPDGRFALNGLTPGAHYVMYIDRIVRGGFSTQPAFLTYGMQSEEFWNAGESGDAGTDARCASSTLAAAQGQSTPADMLINRPANEHLLRVLPHPGFTATDVSADGGVIVGLIARSSGGFTAYPVAGHWSEDTGLQEVPGSLVTGGGTHVNAAGDVVFTSFADDTGVAWAGTWRVGDVAARRLEGGVLALTSCDANGTSIYDVGLDGDVIVGLAWRSGCKMPFAFKWTPSTGYTTMAGVGPITRANAVSEDGTTVVGWNDSHRVFQGRQGVWWHRGRQTFASPTPATRYWSEAHDVSSDGKVIVGSRAESKMPWLAMRDTGARRWLGELVVPDADPFRSTGLATKVSSDGTVVLGFWGDTFSRRTFLWTDALGMVDLSEFLFAQGADHARHFAMGSISGMTPDDKTIVGWGWSGGATMSFTSRLDTVAVCTDTQETQYVEFPHGMEQAVRGGARAGRCDRLGL
jgi:probable HAF family extracellular repeat protein